MLDSLKISHYLWSYTTCQTQDSSFLSFDSSLLHCKGGGIMFTIKQLGARILKKISSLLKFTQIFSSKSCLTPTSLHCNHITSLSAFKVTTSPASKIDDHFMSFSEFPDHWELILMSLHAMV